jgi:hypothetical protein
MILTENQKKDILSNFPDIKLSYGNILHNKVCNADIMFAIPEGNKCFIWFTKYEDKSVCFIIELLKNKFIKNIKIVHNLLNNILSKDKDVLSKGTIFYGTLFYINNNEFFTIEDIFFYKDINVKYKNWFEKYVLLKKIISTEITQTSIIFGLPILSNSYDDLISKIKAIKYKIHIIQFKHFNKSNIFFYMRYQNQLTYQKVIDHNVKYESSKNIVDIHKSKDNYNKTKKTKNVFNIVPDIQNDIYYLKCYNNNNNNNNNNLVFYDTAHIPDFKTSVFMNKLFRNIKENENLDKLEESDDENEFENINADKFVYLNKNYNMLCSFCNKFKKWVPIELANENLPVVNIKDLQTKL